LTYNKYLRHNAEDNWVREDVRELEYLAKKKKSTAPIIKTSIPNQ
jgi:hypothetical protein